MYLDMGKPRRVAVQLWDDEATEAWLRLRLPPLQQAYDHTAQLAPVLSPDHPDAWQCKNCEVAEICGALDALADIEEE